MLILLRMTATFLLTLITAISIETLNIYLAVSTVIIEIVYKIQPKAKIKSFKLIFNHDLEDRLEEILRLSNKDLRLYLSKGGAPMANTKIVKQDLKKQLIELKKDYNLISYSETEKIIKQNGLDSFLHSIKQTTNSYSSLEQQEKYFNSSEMKETCRMLVRQYILRKKDVKVTSNIGLLSVSKTILSRTVHSYIKENIILPTV
ncbi:hypothetical protein ACPBEI_12635 (plasmid) [Latilactobacillus sakei]